MCSISLNHIQMTHVSVDLKTHLTFEKPLIQFQKSVTSDTGFASAPVSLKPYANAVLLDCSGTTHLSFARAFSFNEISVLRVTRIPKQPATAAEGSPLRRIHRPPGCGQPDR
jgi:hypothetical protein